MATEKKRKITKLDFGLALMMKEADKSKTVSYAKVMRQLKDK